MASPLLTCFRCLVVVAVLAVAALSRAPAAVAQTPQQGEPVDLVRGCTNVSLTWPANTPLASVAAAITPAGSVDAIWKLDAVSQRFLAWSAVAPQASDLATVNPLDAVFICTNAVGVLMRPVLNASAPPTAALPVVAVAIPVQPTAAIVSYSERMWRSGTAYITVASPPGTWCDIQYTPPPGTPASTTALGPKRVDQTGQVTWLWTVVPFTPPGPAYVVVLCNGVVLSATITIV